MEEKRELGYHPELDGLRAIAIAGVIGVHLRSKWLMGGEQGVTLFFVLSGFLITTNLILELSRKGDIDVSAFYAKRMARLYPALMVALLANIIFYSPKIGLEKMILFSIPALFYISNFYRAANIYLPGLGHSWTLSVEGQFYLIWPWVVRKFMKSSVRKLLTLCIAAVIILEIIRFLYTQSTGNWYHQTYYSLWSRGGAILFGALASIWWTRKDRRKLPMAQLWALLGITTIILVYAFGNNAKSIEYTLGLPITSLAAVSLILGLCESQGGIVSRVLKLPPIVHIGRISYSIYLYNTLMIEAWRVANKNLYPHGFTNTLFWLLATFAIAEISYMYIEQPFLKWARPFIKNRSTNAYAISAQTKNNLN